MAPDGNLYTLPLFPLSNVVLFPGLRVPLHIFEERYKQMTAHALAQKLPLAMVTANPEHALTGNPPIFSVGCAGSIQRAQKFSDGRCNLLLSALWRFRIESELPLATDRLYRVAEVSVLEESTASLSPALRQSILGTCEEYLRMALDRDVQRLLRGELRDLPDPIFINALCQLLDLPPLEKQSLLEEDHLALRAERLQEFLRFHVASAGASSDSAAKRLH